MCSQTRGSTRSMMVCRPPIFLRNFSARGTLASSCPGDFQQLSVNALVPQSREDDGGVILAGKMLAIGDEDVAAEVEAIRPGDGSLACNDFLTPCGGSGNVRTMTKKSLLQIGGFLAACACLPLGVVAIMPPSRGGTEAKLERIKSGMAKEEVEDIFGAQGTEFPWMGVDSFSWPVDDGGFVAIWFESGHVRSVYRYDPEETTFQIICRWLDFSPPPPPPPIIVRDYTRFPKPDIDAP